MSVPAAANGQAAPVSILIGPPPRWQRATETTSANAAHSEKHAAQTTAAEAAAAAAAAEPVDALLKRAAWLKAQARKLTEACIEASEVSTGASTSRVEMHDQQQNEILRSRPHSPSRLNSPGFGASEDSTAASDFGSAVVAVATTMGNEQPTDGMEDRQHVALQRINNFWRLEASEDAIGQHGFGGARTDSMPETINELFSSVQVLPPEMQAGEVSETSSPMTRVQEDLEITMTRLPGQHLSQENVEISQQPVSSRQPEQSHDVMVMGCMTMPAKSGSSVTTATQSSPRTYSSSADFSSFTRADTDFSSFTRADTDDLQAGQLQTPPQPLTVDGAMVTEWAEPFVSEQAQKPVASDNVRREDEAEHLPSFNQERSVLDCFADVNEAGQLGPRHLPTAPIVVSPRQTEDVEMSEQPVSSQQPEQLHDECTHAFPVNLTAASSVTTLASSPGTLSSLAENSLLTRADADDLPAGQLQTPPHQCTLDGAMVSEWAETFVAEQASQPLVGDNVRWEDETEHPPINEANQVSQSHLPTPPIMISPRKNDRGPVEEGWTQTPAEAEPDAVVHPEAETCTSPVVESTNSSSSASASYLTTPPVMISPRRKDRGLVEEGWTQKSAEAEPDAVMHPEAKPCTSPVVETIGSTHSGESKEWHIWRRGAYMRVKQLPFKEQQALKDAAQCSVSEHVQACDSPAEMILSDPDSDNPADGPKCEEGDGFEPEEWNTSKSVGGWNVGWEPLFQRESWCMATGACFARQPRFEETD